MRTAKTPEKWALYLDRGGKEEGGKNKGIMTHPYKGVQPEAGEQKKRSPQKQKKKNCIIKERSLCVKERGKKTALIRSLRKKKKKNGFSERNSNVRPSSGERCWLHHTAKRGGGNITQSLGTGGTKKNSPNKRSRPKKEKQRKPSWEKRERNISFIMKRKRYPKRGKEKSETKITRPRKIKTRLMRRRDLHAPERFRPRKITHEKNYNSPEDG